MNRILINICCALLLITTARAQSVGIGTNQPDASAALDITSSNKGFLIPRVDMGISNIPAPATGLLVYNTNNAALYGRGLYINMGTMSAPKWERLASSESDNFIRNQTGVQVRSNFHISNNGIIDGKLTIDSKTPESFPLAIGSSSSYFTGFYMSNISGGGYWVMRVNGTNSIRPGTFQIVNLLTGRSSIFATGDQVGINMTTEPTAALEVGGDIKAQGSFIMDVKYVRGEFTLPGNSYGRYSVSCPSGYQVISGGGGHRDYNSAAIDIRVNYSGPDPDAPSTKWRVIVDNTSRSSRTVLVYCNCAKVK